MSTLQNGWEVVIGLEIHAQISANTKLFSASSTESGAEPNTNVSLFDAAFPGTLPVLNQYCIDQAIKTGLAINGTIHEISVFDRKNYFYPDLPSGYQITQFYHPIVTDGKIDIISDNDEPKTIRIERIHIEQDAGKSIHDLSQTATYIDLNRAGIPLMEIVSKPDIRSANEAMLYVKKLRTILRYIGACEGNMENGNLRVDANVSVHKPNTDFGVRAEIKNINSIKFLGQAITYEANRQIEVIENGGNLTQETRLFDSATGETRSMREKENAADYRYFPEPDLNPVVVTPNRIADIKNALPELPNIKKERFIKQYAISEADADILTEDIAIADNFEQIVATLKNQNSAKLVANWLIVEVFAFMNQNALSINKLPFDVQYIADLVDLIVNNVISGKIAKTVFAEMCRNGAKPSEIVDKMGLKQISDDNIIRSSIATILEQNKDKVAEYKAGKEKLFGFFVGLIMKELHGKGNPEMINKILMELL